MSESSGFDNHAQAKSRCLLLVGEAEAVPSGLVAALGRRGLEVVIMRHPPEVMIELAETRGGNGRPRAASVVIVEPAVQPRVDELRRALRSYHSHAKCWSYEAQGGGGRLEAFDWRDERPEESDLTGQEVLSQADLPTIKGSGKRLRSLIVKVDANSTPSNGPVVSEEELSMLLGTGDAERSDWREDA